MKSKKKVLNFIIISIISYILTICSLLYINDNYLEYGLYSDNSLLEYSIELKLNKNNCELIKKYTDHDIHFSVLKHKKLEKIIYIDNALALKRI